MGAFDDLVPTATAPTTGAFDDLVPATASPKGAFDDLVPTEPASTWDKTRFAAVKGAAQTIADIGTAVKRLEDIGPLPTSFANHERAMINAGNDWDTPRIDPFTLQPVPGQLAPGEKAMSRLRQGHEALRTDLMQSGAALETKATAAAQAAGAAETATPGVGWMAKGAELAGGMLPFLLTGPAAPATGGLASYGSTYNQALQFYRDQGMSEEDAKAAADKAGAAAGLTSGVVFAALPGVGQSAAERMLAKHLGQATPIVRAAVNTLAAGAQGSTVLGADSLLRNAQAVQTFKPNLSWGEALHEAAQSAVVGGIASGAAHAPMEAIGLAAGRVRRSAPETPAAPATAAEPSEFGDPSAAAPVPEAPGTLAAQLGWLQQGKRAAVLLTPGETAPAVPDGIESLPTDAGTFLYDPAKLNPTAIQKAVAENRVGDLLGYGIPAKPQPGTEAGVVTVRGADGTEKQAVVTDLKRAPEVLQAAKAVADPTDKISLETPQQVTAGRGGDLSGIERKYVSEAVAGRYPIKAELVDRRMAEGGFALPEGYGRQGDLYIYREPAVMETPAQRQARFQQQAMEGLRAQPTPEPAADPEATPVTPTERPEPGVPIQAFERPHDIIDAVEEHFPGVRVPEDSDFADVRERIKGLRQSKAADLSGGKLKRIFRGEAPDTALQQLHASGAALRIQSGHDLLHAMVDAAQTRLAWAQQEKAAGRFEPAAPAPEEVDPWQATIDKLNSLKLDTRGQLHAFGLLPEAWNRLIDLVNLGLRGGRALSDAVDWAMEQFKAKFPDQKFDEAGARDHLNANFVPSKTAARAIEDATPAVKAAIDPNYEAKPLPTTADQANAILQTRGLQGAIQTYQLDPGMPEDVRVALGAFIDDHLRTQAAVARAAGDTAKADAFEQQQVEFFNGSFRPQGTELGRAVNAFKLFGANSAQTWLKQYKQSLMDAAGRRFDRVKPAVDAIVAALRQAHAATVEAIRRDPATNEAARAAVDAVVGASPETHQAVIMEMAEPWAHSPEIVNMAREAVRAKADELLNQQPRPPQFTPAQHLRGILDDLARRAASIASGHYQGAEPGVTLRDKLMQRLGLAEKPATALARQMDMEFARQIEAAKAKIPKRIATMRAAQLRNAGLLPTSPDSAVDAALRRQLAAQNQNLGALLRQAAGTVAAAGRTVADRIVQASGLTGPEAEQLRATLDRRWNAISAAKREQLLKAIQSPAAQRLLNRPGLAQRILQASNLGAFDDAKIYDAVREKLKLPAYNAAIAKEIVRRANALQQLPKGSLMQARGVEDLMNFIRQQHGIKLWEAAQSYWYANLLSGLTTQAKVIVYNLTSVGSHAFVQAVQHPTAIPQMIEAVARALPKAADTAGALLRDGSVPGIGVKMFEHEHGLEQYKGPIASKALLPWKAMLRGLGAQHLILFKPAAELKALILARAMAAEQGAPDTAARAREILGWTDQARATAEAQADTEGVKGLDYRRRVAELLEQQRPPELQAAATDWAKRATAVEEPYGILGALGRGFDTAAKSAPILNLVVPFRRIVANVANDSLNWTPIGNYRAVRGWQTGKLYDLPIADKTALADLHAQAIVGTTALSALAYAAANGIIGITAQGPADPEQRKTLQSTTGWIPYSIKIGNHYFSYMDRPFGMPLAIIGHYLDAMKYQKLDQEDALNRVAYATLGARTVLLDSGWLQGLAGVFNQADAYSTKNAAEKAGTTVAKTASGFVPLSQLLKQIDRTFDPKVYDGDGIRAKFLMQLPFVRREGRPVLNRFGQPITSTPAQQFLTTAKPDPIVSLLVNKKALPADVGKGELTDDEYYLLVKTAGPQFYRALAEHAADIAAMKPKQAKAYVEYLSTDTTTAAKKTLGLDTIETVRKTLKP